MANCHLCTSLWFVRLRDDGLLELLPEELQEYLRQLHQANVERNDAFRSELKMFLEALAAEAIPAVLLKGAATFVDDLYNDPGARVMGDLDILIKPTDTEKARSLLQRLGYLEIPDPRMAPEGLPTDCRHHQLPRYYKPGTPVVIEIHFKVSYGQAGRVISAEAVWGSALPMNLEGVPVLIPPPHLRLLHNAAHALLPHGEFIRGNVSLLQLAEFVHLQQAAGAETDWAGCWETGSRHGLTIEFGAYLVLAQRLMNSPAGFPQTTNWRTRFEVKRLLLGGKRFGIRGEDLRRVPIWRRIWFDVVLKGYYYLSLPRWVWLNVCYAEGHGALRARFRLLMNKLASPYSRSKAGY